jgi:hypothetical protein
MIDSNLQLFCKFLVRVFTDFRWCDGTVLCYVSYYGLKDETCMKFTDPADVPCVFIVIKNLINPFLAGMC